ncbi:hypothetical protein PSHT_15446 [Puccinia striiformis]|uniref:Uncharacterized protein n=1 Tax=Puccinia striiformis TaxID=27350 RepID=A0A2S4UFA8_9BASI|nr:hypothetical protein PSHT_15446 [Puccinia striiformis]
MPVTGNGPFLSSSARRPGSNQRAVASTPVIRNVPFLSDTVSNSFRFGDVQDRSNGEYPGSTVIDGESNRSSS